MESVSISWLVASAISPLVAVLALWTLYVFHTYRRRWRTVDLFLLTLSSTELIVALLTFCFSILNLVHQQSPAFRLPCTIVRWGQVATRTFQMATLTSMVVDRALTVRWPYRYRFSVRRNQIRYHIGVLAMVSALVAVAAVFAHLPDQDIGTIHGKMSDQDDASSNVRIPDDDQSVRLPIGVVQEDMNQDEKSSRILRESPVSSELQDGRSKSVPVFEPGRCHLHPVQWDSRYALFLLCLYSGLLGLWLFCTVQVELHRGRPHVKLAPPECVSPDLPTGGMNSPLDTQSSTGSTRALHRPSRQASRRPYCKDGKGTSDLRWPSVAFASLLCFAINHLPYLVVFGIATWRPLLWSEWHEPGLAWLGLLEGLLVPLLLFCRDAPLRAALRRAFQRRSGALSPLVGDDGPFQMYFDKDHFRKRGTFGSVTPIGIITNYRRHPSSSSSNNKRRSGGKGGGAKYTLPGLHGSDSVLPKSFLGGNAAAAEPLSKLSCADLTSLGMWREEEEEYYATLSDDFSTFSCKSGDDSALSEDLRMGEEELYGGSFTTVANDDFEFHDTRPCGGEVKMKPALLSPDTPLPPPSRNTSFRDHIRPKVSIPKVFPEPRRDLFVDLEEERKDPNLFILPPPATTNKWDEEEEEKEQDNSTPSTTTPPRNNPPQRKPTSLSMNDLDLIYKKGHPPVDLETTFILPVKSESTMSLYRLNVDQDADPAMMTPSRSETNINNGDSGFGSGAQSTNPVWSGFLCRKPSDPFWNMRKPTVAAPASNGNYPVVMHSRMRKIPWISAWKKLDENSRLPQQQIAKDSSPEEDGDALGWKENLVYEANGALAMNPRESIIDEELSDVGTPVYAGDYNLNVFAKTTESGVLMENAFGKIVRDDCGVKVDFYSKQYDDTIARKDPVNCLERSAEVNATGKDPFEMVYQNGDYSNCRQPLEGMREANVNLPKDLVSNALPVESVFCGRASVTNEFKCEPRLNGGHYENLFGTKENIFAQCDPYAEKAKAADPQCHFEKRSDREESFRFSKDCKGESVYGQLNKPEHFGNSKNVGRSPSKSKELRRRESDNRGNRCGIKRRESRTRSDPRPNAILETAARRSFAEIGNRFDDVEKSGGGKSVEIEMQNVKSELKPESRFPKVENYNNINQIYRENEQKRSKLESSGNQKHRGGNFISPGDAKVERRDSRSRDKDYNKERKSGVERKHSGRKTETEQKDSVAQSDPSGHIQSNIPSRISQLAQRKESGLPVRVERRNSDKISKPPSYHPKAGLSPKPPENRNGEGLWANAIPFNGKDEENGNSPRRGSRRDKQQVRSPRKSNLPRRESNRNEQQDANRNERPRVKRKASANRVLNDPTPEVKTWAKDPCPEVKKWTKDSSEETRNIREDNFGQDLSQDTSRRDFCGKLNGNIPDSRPQNGEMYPFDMFQKNGGTGQYSHANDNENVRERKLAITDFL